MYNVGNTETFHAGHTRQGLRCRICKVNVHADCAPQLSKCQTKTKLLRRQKSTSEIENKMEQEEESEYTDRRTCVIINGRIAMIRPISIGIIMIKMHDENSH